MNKKLSLLVALFLMVGATNLYSLGVGLQANANADEFFEPGMAITFKLDETPLYFALNWNIQEKNQDIGLTADYWAMEKSLVYVGNSPLNFFFGLGLFCNLSFNQNDGAEPFTPGIGMRVPVGINMYIADGVIEPFIQVAPSFGVHLLPSLGADEVYWPFSAGFRIWL